MAYKLMKQLIKNGTKTQAQLLQYCDVYFAAGRLTEDEYMELVAEINAM